PSTRSTSPRAGTGTICVGSVVAPDAQKAWPTPVIDGEATVVPPAPKSECPSWLRRVPKTEERIDGGPPGCEVRCRDRSAAPARECRSGNGAKDHDQRSGQRAHAAARQRVLLGWHFLGWHGRPLPGLASLSPATTPRPRRK